MKWLKKILRIIAILLPCFCCLALPHNTFATTYMIDSFNAHGLYYIDHYIGNQPTITVLSGVTSRQGFEPRYFANIAGNYNTLTDRCGLGTYNRGVNISNDNIYFGGAFYVSPPSGNATCRRLNGVFGDNMPTFVNPTTDNPNYVSIMNILPNNTLFTTTPFVGTRTRDGVVYTGRLSLMSYLNNLYGSADDSSDIDNNNANDRVWTSTAVDVHSFAFPINFGVTENIDSMVIEGSITFKPNETQRTTYGSVGYMTSEFNSHGVIRIRSKYVYLDGQYFRDTEQLDLCQYSYSNNLLNLNYICNINLSHTAFAEAIVPHLEFDFDTTDPAYHLFNSEDVTFNEIRITTNGQASVVVKGSRPDYGAHPTVAPGMPDLEDAQGNWTDSFMNAIHFSLLNPFIPLYSLFLPPSQCASIPTVATMIHSEQNRICPLYPDWVYPITTPVIGIVSMMLLFGFLMRWLNDGTFARKED